MEKYMFIYLKTGGGHYAPAKAIAETIKNIRSTEIEIILHDGLSDTRPYIRKIIQDGYKNSVNRALWSFEMLYAIGKIKPVTKVSTRITAHFIKPAISKVILKEKPDKIIIYHFLMIRPVNEILRENNIKTPVVVVVTDPFTAPSGWFLIKDQKYIVFSDILKKKCIKMGINSKNIQVFPFVLDHKFSILLNNSSRLRVRKELGFREDSKIILIMGGGDGMPRGEKIFRTLIAAGIDAEIAVVCGRDSLLFKQLTELKEKNKLDNTRIFGFIDFTYALIQISDIVITKAGASVCMEILLAEKVPIINNYIWEQEKGNMEFVCKSSMGIYKKNPRQLPDLVNKLLSNKEYYNLLINNIRKNMIRNGVEQVSQYIMNYN
ncbi:MAG: glycosyltransferase [Bacteroidales bacterium]